MAKNDNVKDFCKDIADAIREKKGTSDLINPQDFSAEIKSISGGGGGASESSIEYLDLRGLEYEEFLPMMSLYACTRSKVGNPKIGVMPTAYLYAITGGINAVDILAVAIDLSAEVFSQGQFDKMPLGEFMSMMGADLSTYPRLTKEQFYSLE